MKDPRKKALASKLISTRELAEKTREQIAGRVFKIEEVSEAISVMAAKGFDTLNVMPDTPLDLRETVSAKETVELLRDAGFAVSWEKRQPRADEPGLWVLKIDWRSPQS